MDLGFLGPIQNTGQYLYDYYLWTLSLADRRSQGWLMVDSPVPTLLYTVIYLAIVGIGPRVMEKRRPFHLNWCLVPYNLAMSLLNLYIGIELLIASSKLKYSYVCQPVKHSNHEEEMRIVNAVWWYYFSKLLEFCDTFFFILRKKDKQLTFLHVYHHSTMFSLWWIGIKWVPSGSTFLPAMVNSFIHVLMYAYYGLSALGPVISQYLWWKKYLTILQLIQFTTALIMGINGIRSGCDFPLWMQYGLVLYMVSFIVLFGNFYAKAYIEKIVNAVWWYYFSKLLEFCDTFFFILRKKDKQLTFLHVYHHSTMFSLWWIGIKWVPSGSTFLPAMVNSFIHVLMYAYYGLSALGPVISQYLWWKKYLTILQLIQFTTALIMGINGIRSGCDFPLWMQYGLVLYMVSFIVLFGNFYAKAYIEKGKRAYGYNTGLNSMASTSKSD